MGAKTIVIFLSSVRPGRMADRVCRFVERNVAELGMNVKIFDPLDMKFEMVREPLHYMPDPTKAPRFLHRANLDLETADGFIIASTEYNGALPPALTNMMAHFSPKVYRHRPCGLIGYSLGPFGGIRALTLLRAYACEFGMIPMPTNAPIPFVDKAFREDGSCIEPLAADNIIKLTQEVSWYAHAIKNYAKVNSLPQ